MVSLPSSLQLLGPDDPHSGNREGAKVGLWNDEEVTATIVDFNLFTHLTIQKTYIIPFISEICFGSAS